MRVSFDLDDTLICYQPDVPREPNRVPWLLRRWFPEPLRLGTVGLINRLQVAGCDVGIYTTSYRTEQYIRWFFFFHGLRLDFVVNQWKHEATVGLQPSKHPRKFGIDMHFDDSTGVVKEGKKYGFQCERIDPFDLSWSDFVLQRIQLETC